MSSALEMLEADLKTETAKFREILDAADSDGRPVSEAERKTSEDSLEHITELKSRIEASRAS